MKRYLKIGILAVVLVLVVKYFAVIIFGIGHILDAATPLAIGGVLAYILNLLLKQLEKIYFPKSTNKFVISSRRPVCIVLSIVLMLCIIALVITLVIPEIISSFQLLGKEIPGIVDKIVQWLVERSDHLPTLQNTLENLNLDWSSIFKKAVNVVTSGATGVITSVVSVIGTAFSTLANIFIGIVFTFYLLFNKERLLNQLGRLLSTTIKPSIMEKLVLVAKTTNHTFGSFIVGQFTEALILGSLCTIGMFIFQFPYAVMTGAVVGVTALIPIVGAYIGAGVGAFMILTVDPFQALLFLVFLVVLQQLEGNLVYPRVVGTSIGLPGMWVLAAITIGGGIFGIVGMLLGVPVAATVYKLLRIYVKNKEAKSTPVQSTEISPTIVNTSMHYDILVDEENDPVHDPKPLQDYMNKWDGPAFINQMQLSISKSVLEIGVGTGRLAVQTAPLCGEFCGVDISSKTIERAKENLAGFTNVRLICADFLSYKFDRSFDVVYSSLTFMHIADKQNAVNKIAGLLNDTGRFVVSIDKNQSPFIDTGTRRIKIYPDRMDTMAEYINAAGLRILNQYDTECATIFVALKEL